MGTRKILLVLFLLTLVPRLYHLGATAIYPDEITWMVFGKEIVYAAKNRDINYLRHGWWNRTNNNQKETYTIGLPVIVLNGIVHVLFAGSGQYSLHLFSDVTASRIPIVVLNSLVPVAIFYYLNRFGQRRLGILTAIAYSVSPVVMGLDRWVMHDTALTLFSFCAIASFCLAWKDKAYSFWPGIFLALAFLEKPAGLIVGLVWFLLTLIRLDLRLIFKNTLSFWVTLFLWPESWFNPVISVFEYLGRQASFSNIGQSYFFFGSPTQNLPWHYYFFQISTRLPEIAVFGLLLSVVLFFRKSMAKSDKLIVTTVGLYVVVFLMIFGLATLKNGFRYILPVIPWIYIASVWAILEVKFSRFIYALLLTTSLLGWRYFPNQGSLYYNAFVGGGRGAQSYDLVGLCLGDKAALKYLDANTIEGLVSVLGCYDTGPYNTQRSLTKNWKVADIWVLEYAHWQQFPNNPEVKFAREHKLIQTISENGVTTAEIYARF